MSIVYMDNFLTYSALFIYFPVISRLTRHKYSILHLREISFRDFSHHLKSGLLSDKIMGGYAGKMTCPSLALLQN